MSNVRRIGTLFIPLVAVALVSWSAEIGEAAEEKAGAATVAPSGAVTPVAAATKPSISFGSCRFQKTPPYEPRTKLECGDGEVVVAVFEDGIRCCELKLQ